MAEPETLRIINPYDPRATNENFDLEGWAAQLPPELLTSKELRKAMTKYDPFLFAMLYLDKHLKNKATGVVSFSDAHFDWVQQARLWAVRPSKPAQHRDAYIAPRAMGKSTWFFLILPLWAAAHHHVRFVAAFADTAQMAEGHLSSFKHELDTNELLREDFVTLCRPARRGAGTAVSDNRSQYQAQSGLVFAARGMDTTALGMKVEDRRPDLIIFDDIEPDAAKYSPALAAKRLGTMLDAVLPMGLYARVCVVGTVTMDGSIVHQLARSARGEETSEWVKDENFKAHYYAPIIETADGERSIWPETWDMDWMNRNRHTRSFAKNMLNEPVGADGTYWSEDSFHYLADDDPRTYAATYISVDPAVSSGKNADYTGFAVVSYRYNTEGHSAPEGLRGQAILRHASHRRVSPGPDLRTYVLNLLAQYPETLKVIIETNQGGDMWTSILHSLPVRLTAIHQKTNKDVRAAQLLTDYDMGRVLHDRHHADIETEMLGFTGQDGGGHDDMIDAVGTAVEYLRNQERLRLKQKIAARNTNHGTTYA